MIQVEEIPLFKSPYYSYTSPMVDKTYEWTFSYNNRMQRWIINLAASDGEKIVSGLVLSYDYPHYLDYTIDFPGVIMLLPIGKRQNETISNPYEIYKYYKLFFIYDDGAIEE